MQRSNFKSRGTMGKRPAKPLVNRLAAARSRGVYSPRYLASVKAKETGFVDLALAAYACDTTGSLTLIATVPQGASVNQRVGKKIALKSLQCRGSLVVNTATTLVDTAVLIVYDKRPTGALPTITDVLVTANSESMNNDANSGRFRILKRLDMVLMGNSTTPATGQESKELDFWLDLKGASCVFKAAGTGAIADIEEGALYLITVGNVAAGTSAATAGLGFRTRFYDV